MASIQDRIEAATFLNTKGYDIEIDENGFWLEDQRWHDCKTKEIVDEMDEYAKSKQLAVLDLLFVSDSISQKTYYYFLGIFGLKEEV